MVGCKSCKNKNDEIHRLKQIILDVLILLRDSYQETESDSDYESESDYDSE